MEVINTSESSDTNNETLSAEARQETTKLGPQSSKGEGKDKDIGIVTVVLISLITSVLSVFCYDHFVAQKIVIADLEGYMMAMKKAAETGQIGVDQFGVGLDEVKKKLDTVPKKNVILLGSVVLNPRNIEIIPMPGLPQGNTTAAAATQPQPAGSNQMPSASNLMVNGSQNPQVNR